MQVKALKGLELIDMEYVVYNNSSVAWYNFMRDYLGSAFAGYAEGTEEESIKGTDEFKNMPCFPKQNSVRIINGYVVVRLS